MTVRNMTKRGWLVLLAIWVATVTVGVLGLYVYALSWVCLAGSAVMLSAPWWPWFQKPTS